MSGPRRNFPRAILNAPWSGGVLFLACFLSGCERSPDPAVIGLPILTGLPGVGDVAQQVLDSSPGFPILIVPDSGGPTSSGDSATSLAAAVTVAGRMVTIPHLIGIVGHAGSRDALIAAPVYNANEILQVVPTGTSRALARAGPWTFALAPDDSLEGEFLARFAVERLHSRSATIVYLTDEYGNGLRLSTARALRARGVRILDEVPLPHDIPCDIEPFSSNTSNRLMALLLRGTPDLVVLATRTRETACALKSLAHQPGLRYLAGDGTIVPNGELIAPDSLYVAAFWHPGRSSAESNDFIRRFQRVVGRVPHTGDAMTYDAIMTLAGAIRTVGDDRNAVREYLMSLGRSRPAATGVSGSITFPASGASLVILKRSGGQWKEVEFP